MHLGDGWHVYPVKDGVLNSLRWEQLRNGVQASNEKGTKEIVRNFSIIR